jgi:uncharacterized lipoprotein YddW (UPF0748 family)
MLCGRHVGNRVLGYTQTMLSAAAFGVVVTSLLTQNPQPPRFQLKHPLPAAPGIMMDARQEGEGLATQLARQRKLQGRMLWIDATANLDKFNTEQKIVELLARIKDSGFNTFVLDVKPISGQVIYPSRYAPKIEEWRGRTLPADFDPVPIFSREAKRHKLSMMVSLNAFSEGHRNFKVGPGYETVDRQTVLYEPKPFVKIFGERQPIQTTANAAPRDGVLSVITDPAKVPAPKDDLFAITIDRFGRIVDGFEGGGMGPGRITIPREGSLILGSGELARWLERVSEPGNRAIFEVDADLVPIQDRPDQQIPLMMNPLDAQVVMRNLDLLRELAGKYEFDGILYDDRLRYGGLNADFSPQMRAAFEKWLGRPCQRWPEDVYQITYSPGFARGIVPGPQYENWLIFRARAMRDYVALVRKTLLGIKPSLQFGVYAGSWYGEYASYGVNYGSPDLEAGFWYLSQAYAQTGFADQLDLLVTGCYYRTPTIFDALRLGEPIGRCVESAGYLSNRVADDHTWTYAGISLADFKGDPDGLMAALSASAGSTQGVMVFDLSHDIEPMWPVFKRAFGQPQAAPHQNRQNLLELRRRRAHAIKLGHRRSPVIISAGQAGAGH